MAWWFCLPHQRALWYTHVNSGSLPCAPRLRGSTVSYAGDAHFPKHSLEYSLNLWSQLVLLHIMCSIKSAPTGFPESLGIYLIPIHSSG